jgi:hypothetical protein
MRDKLKRAMQVPGLPNLPTDNYYKFKALAGIWLVAGTVSGLAIGFFHFEREIFDTKARLADLKTESDVLAQEGRREDVRLETQTAATRRLEDLKTEVIRARNDTDLYIRKLESASGHERVTREQIDEARRQMASFEFQQRRFDELLKQTKGELDAIGKTIESRRPATVAHAKRLAQMRVEAERVTTLGYGLLGTMVVGFALIMWGMKLAASGLGQWRQLQEIQDRYLRQQLRSAEDGVEKALPGKALETKSE